MDNNLDAMNVAECICEGMIHKLSKGKTLSKDENLTYCAALRMLKAIFDGVSDYQYKEKEDKENEDDLPTHASP